MKLHHFNQTLRTDQRWFRLHKVSGGYIFKDAPAELNIKYRTMTEAKEAYAVWKEEQQPLRNRVRKELHQLIDRVNNVHCLEYYVRAVKSDLQKLE
jgi:hypothetical protein